MNSRAAPYVEQLRTLLDPAPERFAVLETRRGLTALRWGISVILVFGLIGCVTKGANSPRDPYLASPPAASGRTPIGDFGETTITVQSGDSFFTWCLLLAATEQQQHRGLMQVTDQSLGGYQGMLFRYDTDVTIGFWMRNTPMPLSIAYVASDGHVISIRDMAPCEDKPDCPTYPPEPAAPYRFTIEVPQGLLPALAIDSSAIITDNKTGCPT